MPESVDPLARYVARRNFKETPEPIGKVAARRKRLMFVVQRHDATRLHYDLRLEWKGVLKSWAVTRGPSLDPADKRLAVEVEDHPLDYADFEGVIPKPGYGAGTVQLWDTGLWAPVDASRVDQDLEAGELKFVVAGARLRGGFVLVRLKPRPGEKPGRSNWLLIKERDSAATPGEGDAVLEAATSVKSGRTVQEIAAASRMKPGSGSAKDAAVTQAKVAKKEKARKPVARSTVDPIPAFVPPQLCRLVTSPPAGDAWLHELKLDGYRLQLRVERGVVVLRTRTGLDWTTRFPGVAAAARAMPDLLLDGEVVATDAEGQPSFSRLQAILSGEAKGDLLYYAFDILHDGKRDLREETLERRKALLARLVPAGGKVVRWLDHFDAPGDAVLAAACRLSMEGVVSKRRAAAYRSGRGDDWTKSKCRGRDEFVVGGWSHEKEGRGLGALLVGARREAGLVYLGRVGTGFSAATRTSLVRQLTAAGRATTPFTGRQPARTGDVTWAEPSIVVEVAYGGWTEDGLLRHASFQGVREDKAPADIEPPSPAPATPRPAKPQRRPGTSGFRLTHPERVLWPRTEHSRAVTKADLAAYFEKFGSTLLAGAGRRPLSILRAPDGIAGELFFQRHATRGQSPLIGAVEIAGQPKTFMRVDDAAGLAALAQISAVELHPWGASAERPECPDRLVFDLDPAEGLSFDAVIAAAQHLRERLQVLGLTPFPRITGGKGLHLVVPLAVPSRGSKPGWAEAKQFARLACLLMERDAPDRYTTTIAKKARAGRIFLDYLRNDRLATAIANWSPRGRPGAPVARPVAWSAVRRGLDPAGATLVDLLEDRMPPDPWRGFAAAGGSLADAIRRITRSESIRRPLASNRRKLPHV
jgi:bifunctional non-homologous end joining protein LigD